MALLIRLIMALFTRPKIGLFHPTLTGVQEHSVNVKNYAFDILYEAHHALTISPVIFFSDAAALQISFWP